MYECSLLDKQLNRDTYLHQASIKTFTTRIWDGSSGNPMRWIKTGLLTFLAITRRHACKYDNRQGCFLALSVSRCRMHECKKLLIIQITIRTYIHPTLCLIRYVVHCWNFVFRNRAAAIMHIMLMLDLDPVENNELWKYLLIIVNIGKAT